MPTRSSPLGSILFGLLVGLPCLSAGCVSSTEPVPELECPEGYSSSDEEGHCVLDELPVNDEWPAELSPQPDCENPAPPDVHVGLWDECTSIHTGDVFFRTQAEVDTFCDSYDCVQGGVDVGDDEGGDRPGEGGNSGDGAADPIVNLDGLSCLRAARYLFVSNNSELVDAALPSLVGLGGGLNYAGNLSLVSVSVPELRFAGEVAINNHPNLQDLDLQSLQAVLGFFSVTENPRLPTSQVEEIRDQMCPQDIRGAVMIAGNGS